LDTFHTTISSLELSLLMTKPGFYTDLTNNPVSSASHLPLNVIINSQHYSNVFSISSLWLATSMIVTLHHHHLVMTMEILPTMMMDENKNWVRRTLEELSREAGEAKEAGEWEAKKAREAE
jgi:hypothetical protein